MFGFFKKKKKKEEDQQEEKVIRPQRAEDGFYRGMYCPVCGYMEVHPDSNELPMEGFALCANCGATMKRGLFMMDSHGAFTLSENAGQILEAKRKKTVSGGHYRVRPKGPYRGRFHGHFTSF